MHGTLRVKMSKLVFNTKSDFFKRWFSKEHTQLTFTCSKSTIEMFEKVINFEYNSHLFPVFLLLTLNN